MSTLLPPGFRLQFLSRIGFSNPTARRFSSSVANSRSRAFRKTICAAHKKKSQRIYTSMHLTGLELTKLTYTRLEDNNLIRHRGDRLMLVVRCPVCCCIIILSLILQWWSEVPRRAIGTKARSTSSSSVQWPASRAPRFVHIYIYDTQLKWPDFLLFSSRKDGVRHAPTNACI